MEGRGQQGRGRPSLRNFNPSPFLRLGLPSPFHHDVLLITFCPTISFHDLSCTFSQMWRSAPRLPGKSCGRMNCVLVFRGMEMTRLGYAHCQLMYPACSCKLEDHELIKLAVSVLREVRFTAVGLQTSMPIAYCLFAGCLWAGKCLQACCTLGWYMPTLQAVFGLVSAFRQAVLSL